MVAMSVGERPGRLPVLGALTDTVAELGLVVVREVLPLRPELSDRHPEVVQHVRHATRIVVHLDGHCHPPILSGLSALVASRGVEP